MDMDMLCLVYGIYIDYIKLLMLDVDIRLVTFIMLFDGHNKMSSF